jgi:hypothetical protein
LKIQFDERRNILKIIIIIKKIQEMNLKIVLAFLGLAAFVALSEQAGGNTRRHTTHHTKHPKRRSGRTRYNTRHSKRRSHRTRHRTRRAKTTRTTTTTSNTRRAKTTRTTTTTSTTTLVTTTAALWYQWLGYDCTAAFSQGYPVIATFNNVEKCVYPSPWCSRVNPATNSEAVWINNPGGCAKLCYENPNCGFFDYNGATLVCRLHSGNIYNNYRDGFCLANQPNFNTGWIFSRVTYP